jgi:hypothetical protein
VKCRKKPVVVDYWPVRDLLRNAVHAEPQPDPIREAIASGTLVLLSDHVRILTLEGEHVGAESDVVIRGVKGELYPCKPDIFAATYDLVEEPA